MCLRFFKRFDAFSPKGVQTLSIWHDIWHTTLFGIYYCGEMVGFEMHIIENNSHIP